MICSILLGIAFIIIGAVGIEYWINNASNFLYEYLGLTCGNCFAEWSCTAWILIGYLGFLFLIFLGMVIVFVSSKETVM